MTFDCVPPTLTVQEVTVPHASSITGIPERMLGKIVASNCISSRQNDDGFVLINLHELRQWHSEAAVIQELVLQ